VLLGIENYGGKKWPTGKDKSTHNSITEVLGFESIFCWCMTSCACALIGRKYNHTVYSSINEVDAEEVGHGHTAQSNY